MPKWLVWVGLSIYAVIQLIVYTAPARVPDEDWFYSNSLSIAENIHARGWIYTVATQSNLLGYGASCWSLYGIITALTSHSFLVMSLLAWFSILLVIIALLLSSRQTIKAHRYVAVGLWLAMAPAWWVGKLTGPDVYVMGLAALGLHCVIMQPKRWQVLAGGRVL